jgi:hypothetical protein
MDQDILVTDQTLYGRKLIDTLQESGFPVEVAFWGKPTEDDKWYLYLATPVVEQTDKREAYLHLQEVMRRTPDLWIDPWDVKVIGMNDPMTSAVIELLKAKAASTSFAAMPPKPYPGMTRFSGSTLGGISMDGAYIYPQLTTSP